MLEDGEMMDPSVPVCSSGLALGIVHSSGGESPPLGDLELMVTPG